jgi:hypothetical protein
MQEVFSSRGILQVQLVEAAHADFAKMREWKQKCNLVQEGTTGVNALDIVDR